MNIPEFNKYLQDPGGYYYDCFTQIEKGYDFYDRIDRPFENAMSYCIGSMDVTSHNGLSVGEIGLRYLAMNHYRSTLLNTLLDYDCAIQADMILIDRSNYVIKNAMNELPDGEVLVGLGKVYYRLLTGNQEHIGKYILLLDLLKAIHNKHVTTSHKSSFDLRICIGAAVETIVLLEGMLHSKLIEDDFYYAYHWGHRYIQTLLNGLGGPTMPSYDNAYRLAKMAFNVTIAARDKNHQWTKRVMPFMFDEGDDEPKENTTVEITESAAEVEPPLVTDVVEDVSPPMYVPPAETIIEETIRDLSASDQ